MQPKRKETRFGFIIGIIVPGLLTLAISPAASAELVEYLAPVSEDYSKTFTYALGGYASDPRDSNYVLVVCEGLPPLRVPVMDLTFNPDLSVEYSMAEVTFSVTSLLSAEIRRVQSWDARDFLKKRYRYDGDADPELASVSCTIRFSPQRANQLGTRQ